MNTIVVKVHNGYFYKGQQQFTANTGKTLILKAKTGASYELVQKISGKAPEKILIEKHGKDLLVAFADDDNNADGQADLVIKNFFLYPESQLVGLSATGKYYSYLPVQDKYEAFFGKDIWLGNDAGGVQEVALGSYGKITPWLLEANTQPMGSLLKPALTGLAGAGLLLWGAESLGKSSSNDTPKTDKNTPRPDAPAVPKVSDDGKTLAGKAEAGTQIRVSDNTGVIGTATAGKDGNYSVTFKEARVNGEPLRVVAIKDGVESKARTLKSVDTTKPEPASVVRISDDGVTVSGKAEAGATVSVLDANNHVLGLTRANTKGEYKITLRQAQNHQEKLKVQVKDAAGNISNAVDFTGAKGENSSISSIIDLDTKSKTNSVKEDAKVGSTVGITAKATDYEAITYSLADDANGTFTINPTTGVVTTAKALDYEQHTQHKITVRASSADGSNTEKVFTIAVENVNDNKITAATDVDTKTNTVAANASVGSTVGVTVNAKDADDGEKSQVTYKMLENPDGLFSINVNTGVVTTSKSLTGHVGEKTIKVQAISTDGSTSDLAVKINITAASAKPLPSSEQTTNQQHDQQSEHTAAKKAYSPKLYFSDDLVNGNHTPSTSNNHTAETSLKLADVLQVPATKSINSHYLADNTATPEKNSTTTLKVATQSVSETANQSFTDSMVFILDVVI